MSDSEVKFRDLLRLGLGPALAIIVVAVFWQATTHGFVNYDDPQYVTGNAAVQRGLTTGGVAWAFTTFATGNWIPMTWLSHMLDGQLFGLRPSGHHATSILLHAANAWLLFSLMVRLTAAMWPSAIVALLFGLHPLHVESVAWIAERKDVLSTFFGLLCLLAYVRYVREQTGRSTRAKSWFGLSLVWLALGLMSKPMLVTLPCVMLLLDYWPLRRLALAGSRSATTAETPSPGEQLFPSPSMSIQSVFLEKLPFFALVAASCVVAIVAQKSAGAVQVLDRLPLDLRVQNAVVSYAVYVTKTFWPARLAVIYPYPDSFPIWQLALSGALLLATSAVAYRVRYTRPWWLVGWLWYLGMLVPVIGLLQVGSQAMADRYTYLPLVGIFLALVWEIKKLAQRGVAWRWSAGIVGAGVVTICALLTHQQLQHWKSSLGLFQHAVDVTQRNRIAHNNLGVALADLQHYEDAIQHYREAVRIAPNYHDARVNLGVALLRLNRLDEAEIELSGVLTRQPTAVAHIALGNISEQRQQPGLAMDHYRKAIALQPRNAYAHYNLANLLAQAGDLTGARGHLASALEAKPTWTAARLNLAGLLLQSGRLNEAYEQSQLALRTEPNSANAHYFSGIILAQQRQFGAAIDHLQQATRARPDWSEAVNSLAWILATCPDSQIRNGTEAVRLATKATELTFKTNAVTLDVLAAALAESGRYAEATEVATLAKAAAETGQKQLAERIQARLLLYQSGKPYRE